jgi:hypothetical protein
MRLLFICAHWHGLAKLRMHSDLTLDILDELTTSLGEAFRNFQQDICPSYHTKELPREANARRRRQRKPKKDGGSRSEPKRGDESRKEPKMKVFNIQSYKHHSLGDYVETIRLFGTTDSYSTAVVSATSSPLNALL